jgi:anthranilate phosphoribosyltransferase
VSRSLESQRTADWFAEIILGLSDAVRDRMAPLVIDDISAHVVVLPNYGDEDALSAIPLVALMLRRMGITVMVHGAFETQGGLFNCGVFREFGVTPVATRGQAERQLAEDRLVILPAALFSPGLATMLSLRNPLGIRTPAHALSNMLAPVLQTSARSLHVLNVAPWLRAYVANESSLLEAPALLVAAADFPSRTDDHRVLFVFRDGESRPGWRTLLDVDCMPSPADRVAVTGFGATPGQQDPRARAAWTRQHLNGRAGLPLIVANLLACCLYGCGYASDIHVAKAIVAVEPGSFAVAAAS